MTNERDVKPRVRTQLQIRHKQRQQECTAGPVSKVSLACTICTELRVFVSLHQLEIHICVDHLQWFRYECVMCNNARFPTEFTIQHHFKQVHDGIDPQNAAMQNLNAEKSEYVRTALQAAIDGNARLPLSSIPTDSTPQIGNSTPTSCRASDTLKRKFLCKRRSQMEFNDMSSLRLAQLVEENWYSLGDSSKTADAISCRRRTWAQVTASVNSEFASSWTVEQVQKRWKTMRGVVKTENKKCTGGFGRDLKAWEEVIERLVGHSQLIDVEEENADTPMDDESPTVILQHIDGRPFTPHHGTAPLSTTSDITPNGAIASSVQKLPRASAGGRPDDVKDESFEELQRRVLARQLAVFDAQERAAQKSFEASDMQMRVLEKMEKLADEGLLGLTRKPQPTGIQYLHDQVGDPFNEYNRSVTSGKMPCGI